MMKLFLTIFMIVFITIQNIKATTDMNNCNLKYTGKLIIEDQPEVQIGIATSSNLLGRVNYTLPNGSQYQPVDFQFYNCMIEGYCNEVNQYDGSCNDDEEYGFLIAKSVNSKYCATAYKVEGHEPKKWQINHHLCNFDGSNMTLINRQLVHASLNESNNQVIITFEGSPNSETNTGFNNSHAFFHPLGQAYGQNGAVIISNDTSSPRLVLVTA